MKLFDSELKVMEVLWEHEENAAEASEKVSAKQIVDVLSQRIGWNKNTTYTVIKKCIEKGAVERGDPGTADRQNVWRLERTLFLILPQKSGDLGGGRRKTRQNDPGLGLNPAKGVQPHVI